MQGVMEWGKTVMPLVSLMDSGDDVICVLVYTVLIYAFVFLDMLFIHIKLYTCVHLSSIYMHSNIE